MRAKSRTTHALKGPGGILYLQVAQLLRKQIEGSHWVPGEQLPSIEALAQSYAVSIVTVRQALAVLEGEALVQRQQGRGTFVSASVQAKRWLKLESNWEALIKMWGRSKPRPLAVRDAIGLPMLEPGDGVPAPAYRYMRRVHSTEEVPYVVIDLYVDRRLYALSPKRFDTEMVIVVLDSMPQVKIKDARQRLTIATADVEVAELLGIPVGSAVGNVRRVVRDENDTVIYLGEAIYRGDMVRLERVLTKGV